MDGKSSQGEKTERTSVEAEGGTFDDAACVALSRVYPMRHAPNAQRRPKDMRSGDAMIGPFSFGAIIGNGLAEPAIVVNHHRIVNY